MRTPARILVVDDTPDGTQMLKERLGRDGYGIIVARGGEGALAQALELRPDLILLDVAVPTPDGLEVCRCLKGGVSMSFTPIIMLATRTAAEDIVAGFEAGADDYLSKPVDGQMLAARVRAMLRIKECHDTIEQRVQQRTAELAESEQRFCALVESAGDAFFVFRPDGTLVDVNPRACDTLLYDREELLGRSVKDIEPTFDAGAMEWEQLRGADTTVIERDLRRKDGYHFPVEVSLSVMDHRGERLVLALACDIRDRKRAQAALRESTMIHHQLEGELAVAHRIQMSLLPRRFTLNDRVDVHATVEPAREVGGDFYDVFALDGGRIGVVVGDVSGKGVSASLHMAMTKTLINSAAHRGSGPAEILSIVNEALCRDNDSCMFVTVFIGVLDTATGALTYASAGHNPPLLLRRAGGVELIRAPGIAAGIRAEASFMEHGATMTRGDALLLYTDGVSEATSVADELFTEGRLCEECASLVGESSLAIVTAVMREVQAFQMGAPQADDITILALRYV